MDASNLAAHVDPERVFALARSQPRFKAGLAPDKLKGYILDIATQQAANALSASTLQHVEALYEEHEALYGPKPDAKDETAEEWEALLDEAANAKFAPFTEQTGHGWQGEYLDDCQLWDANRRQALAHSFGAAFVEGVLGKTDDTTGGRTKRPGQRLSALGITQPDIDAFAETLGKPQTSEARAQTMAQATEIVHRTVRAYAEDRGDALDFSEFEILIEQATDSEDVLAASAVGGMDPRAEPVETVAAFRTLKQNSGTYLDDLTAMLFADEPPQAAEPTPKEAAKAEKKTRAPREKAIATAETASLDAGLLVLMSDLGGTDRSMAEMLGVQRPALNRIRNSGEVLHCHAARLTNALHWAEDQRAKLSALIEGLQRAGGV